MKKIKIFIFIMIGISGLNSCNLDFAPSDALTGDQLASSSDGLVSLVNGCYALYKDFPDPASTNNWYLRQYYHLSDFASDDIVCGYKTEDDLINSFIYFDRAPEKANINSFWEVSYKMIYGANVAIEIANKKSESALNNQLKGECYFLRAVATHNLVRLFALPYNDANKNKPGVILREESLNSGPKARAALEEVYNYIISNLQTAANFMSAEQPVERSSKGFASKYSAWAMLSRVYLYKGDYDMSVQYADSVIESGHYTLETAENFPTYFINAKNSNETIWCIPFLVKDDKKEASVASMVFNGASCWGEEGASPSLLKEMGYDNGMLDIDKRFAYINTHEPGEKNGVTIYYIGKYSGQDNISTLSSPVMLRLAEVYLNRAEAYAKMSGHINDAIADLNMVRSNRLVVTTGSIDDYLYNLTRDNINSSNILNFVLKERRIELAFEGHRIFDLLRNGKDIVRQYWGFHVANYNGVPATDVPSLSASGVVIKATDKSTIYPIPVSETSNNKLCIQNN